MNNTVKTVENATTENKSVKKVSAKMLNVEKVRKSLKIKRNAVVDFAKIENYTTDKEFFTDLSFLQFDLTDKSNNTVSTFAVCAVKTNECHILLKRDFVDNLLSTLDKSHELYSILDNRILYKNTNKRYIYKLDIDTSIAILQLVLEVANTVKK